MARIVRYVNTASSAGGDGTTNGTSGATRAFVSLNAALAGISTDLTGVAADATVTVKGHTFADISLEIILDGSGGVDSTVASTANFAGVTDTTHRILIRASDDYWGTYTMEGAGSNFGGLLQSNSTTERGCYCFAGFYVNQTTSGASSRAALDESSGSGASADGVRNEFFAMKFKTAANNRGAVRFSKLCNFYACICLDSGSSGWTTNSADYNALVGCSAMDNAGTGFVMSTTSDVTQTVYNCVAFGNTTADWSSGTYGYSGASNNASGDASASSHGSGAVTSITSAAFADYASNDFHPAASGALDGAGTARSENPSDIEGTTRGSSPSIGAYEAAASNGGGATIPIFMNQYRQRWKS